MVANALYLDKLPHKQVAHSFGICNGVHRLRHAADA
jgi:hypothetical protein